MPSSNPHDKSSDTPDIGTGMPKPGVIKGEIITGDNPFRKQMPTTMMSRKGFSKAGKPAVIQVNSHIVEQWPTIDVFQYDVSSRKPSSCLSLTEQRIDHYRQWG